MNPYHKESKATVYNANALEALKQVADGSVNLVVCSPPYYGLRRYAGQPTIFPSDNSCQEHKWAVSKTRKKQRALPPEPKGKRTKHNNLDETGRGEQEDVVTESATCSVCGSWLGFLGNEETPDLYVQHLVQIFRECKRVLHDTGVFFLNLGDGYAANRSYQVRQSMHGEYSNNDERFGGIGSPVPKGMKPKDLIGIPWMTAFALRADGWYLRSAPPWLKRNSLPESISDRPTTSHEYWFMLTKSQKYYWDADAIRKSHLTATPEELVKASKWGKKKKETNKPNVDKYTKHDSAVEHGGNVAYTDPLHTAAYHPAGRNYRTADFFFESLDVMVREQAEYLQHLLDIRDGQGMLLGQDGLPLALVVNPKGFLGEKYLPNSGIDHFAAYPVELVEPIIKAGSPLQRCSKCNSPWVRVVEKDESKDGLDEWKKSCGADANGEYNGVGHKGYEESGVQNPSDVKRRILEGMGTKKTVGFKPSCKCNADSEPGVVLDPFAGTGTSLVAAIQQGRNAIGFDVSEEYCKLMVARIKKDCQMEMQ